MAPSCAASCLAFFDALDVDFAGGGVEGAGYFHFFAFEFGDLFLVGIEVIPAFFAFVS